MSISKAIQDVKLQVRVEDGTNASGSTKVKNLNFNKIKTSATDEELFVAGQAISELQSLPLSEIRTVSTHELTNAG